MAKLLFTSDIFVCKIPKLLFTSENVHKLCTKYSNIYTKSQKIINFLHKRHYDKFSEYVENFPKNLEDFVKKFTSSRFTCPPLRHPAHAIPQISRISRVDWFSAPTFPSFA